MKIPVFCEMCGKQIATFDTQMDVDAGFLEAPCGEKICEDCCERCDQSYDNCPYVSDEEFANSQNIFFLDDFIRDVEAGCFIDYDGTGNALDQNKNKICPIRCNVNYLRSLAKKGCVYVEWFNR